MPPLLILSGVIAYAGFKWFQNKNNTPKGKKQRLKSVLIHPHLKNY
ncbi:hypothetical protein BGP_2060 [Beggiatoa sp. PS]|nr:hypothetical protein BGP_2060 [Beggiatoa sp. PS]